MYGLVAYFAGIFRPMAQLLKFTGWAAAIALSLAPVLPTLAQGPAVAPTPVRSLLNMGSSGADVQELQSVLRLMGYYGGAIDGQFTEATLIAVTRFQQAVGLSQDGIVGSATWTKLLPPAPGEAAATIAAPPAPTAPTAAPAATVPASTAPLAILRKGAAGDSVVLLQQRLRAIGVYSGPIDGVFGDETDVAVKAAQRQAKLEEDGVVGGATWDAIGVK
jgi:N-acetylmuramoyl-L-alanine amidase